MSWQVPPIPPLASTASRLPPMDDELEVLRGQSLARAALHTKSLVLAKMSAHPSRDLVGSEALILTNRLPRDMPPTLLFLFALACGSPSVWNRHGRSETWSKRMLKLYHSPSAAVPLTCLAWVDSFWAMSSHALCWRWSAAERPFWDCQMLVKVDGFALSGLLSRLRRIAPMWAGLGLCLARFQA